MGRKDSPTITAMVWWWEYVNQRFYDHLYLQQPDINQEIYGVPDWLPAVISGQLNEESKNSLKKCLEQSKGEGNFKNEFMYAPNNKVDDIKLIPLSEVTAKDEFFNIKGLSQDD